MNKKRLTAANGRPIADNQNSQTAGQRGPILMQDPWLIEKLAHFDREVIPERRMHAKGSGAYGTFTVTHDITHKSFHFQQYWEKDRLFCPIFHGSRRTRSGRCRTRHTRVCN